MLEMQHSGIELSIKLVDLNCLSIYFVENHPGFNYIKPKIDEGLSGKIVLLIPEILPFRVFWILTTKWNISKKISYEIICYFVQNYSQPSYIGLTQESIQKSFQLSKELNHDIYDCYYLAMALQEKADTILTTDQDFELLCNKLNLTYENPVPLEVLKRFQKFK